MFRPKRAIPKAGAALLALGGCADAERFPFTTGVDAGGVDASSFDLDAQVSDAKFQEDSGGPGADSGSDEPDAVVCNVSTEDPVSLSQAASNHCDNLGCCAGVDLGAECDVFYQDLVLNYFAPCQDDWAILFNCGATSCDAQWTFSDRGEILASEELRVCVEGDPRFRGFTDCGG
ncbi:MAG: hypothetical protein AAF550_12985 [Myxococcota bacterium]